MDKYHQHIIHTNVKRAAKEVEGRLPELPSHPNGRIPMAHIYQVIQTVMGCPAKECDNDRVDDILLIIKDCVDLADVVDVSLAIKHKYKPQVKYAPASLDSFFE